MGDDGLTNVRLPNANFSSAILGNTLGVYKPSFNCKRANCGGEIAAVTAPIDKVLINSHLTKQIVDVVIGLRARPNDYRFTGA